MAKNKKISDHGTKTRAGQLLSSFLRQIAQEETEVATDGEARMITKAESLARKMWDMALGHPEVIKNDVGETIETTRRPDKTMMALIWDRMEGRTPMLTDAGKPKQKIADKVSEQGIKRISKI